MSDIGKAYVQIEPTAKGISKKIEGEMSSAGASGGKSFGSAFSGAIGGVGGVVAGVGKVAAGAVAASTAAVGAFAKSAVTAGATFDSSMSQVAATMGTTVDQIGELRDFALQMGSTTAFSATEAADALNYMALAGYDAETSMTMLPNVLNLAAAGGIDLASASDMVTDAQSALGLSVEETSVMVDQMAKASSKSNTSVSQLGDAILTIGATARGVAGGTQELSTVLGVLADNGIKGAEGGTHLRNAILSLQTPTTSGEVALKKLGMAYEDMYDEAGNMRSLPEIFQQMSSAMEGMSQQSKDAIISGVFNKTDLASINALLNTTTDRWDELSTAIGDADGAAEAMANTQLDNLSGSVTLFKSALEGAQIAVSDQLSPSLKEFVDFGADGLGRLTTAFQSGGLSGAMEEFGTLLSEGISMIVEMAPDMVNAGMELLSALGTGLMDNIDTILFAAGDIMESIFTAMVESTSGEGGGSILQIIEKIAGIFVENYMSFIDLGVRILENILNGMIEALPDIIFYVTEIIEHIGQVLIENAPLIITSAFELIKTLALGLAEALPDLIPTIIEVVLTIVDSLISNVDLLIDAAIALMMGLTEGLISALPVLLDKAPEIIQKLVDAIVNNVPKLLVASAEMITKLVVGIIQNLPKLLESGMKIVTSIKTGIARMFVKLVATGKDIIEKVKNGIKSIDPVKWGQDMIDSFISGIKDRISKVIEAAKDIASTIKEYIGFSEPESGPLSNFHTFAPDMIDLFVSGLKNGERFVKAQMAETFAMPTFSPTTDIIANYESTGATTEERVLAILNQYLPIIAQPDNITVGLEPDSARFFKMMKYEAAKNAQLVGV